MAILNARPPDASLLGTTWNNLGIVFRDLGRVQDCKRVSLHRIASGIVFRDLGRVQEAEVALTRAVDLFGQVEDGPKKTVCRDVESGRPLSGDG
jgi:hypothetical protein